MYKSLKSLVAFAMLAGLATMAPHAAAADECYSAGVRIGTIQKFSSKGVLTKSWEGEMVQEGVRTKQDAGVTNIWKFSVTDPAVAKKLEDLVFAGTPVAVKYCKAGFHNPLVTSTPYVVKDAAAR